MQDETNDLLHQELCSMTWDIINKDILSIKGECVDYNYF